MGRLLDIDYQPTPEGVRSSTVHPGLCAELERVASDLPEQLRQVIEMMVKRDTRDQVFVELRQAFVTMAAMTSDLI